MTAAASVAVLSDVHGVLPVLDAVLAEPVVQAADRVVVCGDHAAGPQPEAVLDRLAGLGDRAVLIRGNADRELVEVARGGAIAVPDPVVPWAAARLRPDQVQLLDRLPRAVVLPVEGFGDVLFCHATPRDDEEVVLVDSRMERWAEVLADVPARVIYVGPRFSSGDYLVTLEYERPMKWGSEYITTIDAFMSELYQPAVSPSSRGKGLMVLTERH